MGPEIRVSSRGAYEHRWRKDGSELISIAQYEGRLTMMVVDVKLGSPPEIDIPHELFELALGAGAGCDISVDGRRFVLTEPAGASRNASIRVALNWTAGLP